MNKERLIEAVRKYPALYDMSDGKYMDSNYKSSLWIKISEEIKQNDENCKKRWSNIRDQFKRSLNKRKTKSGQSSIVIKKYKYEEILQFLLPYIQDRKTISNIDDDDADTNESEIQQEQELQETETDNNQCMQEIRNEGDTDTERARVTGDGATEVQRNDESTTQQSRQSSNRSSGKVSKRRTVRHKQSSSEMLMKYILENNAKKQNECNKSHPIDDFFNCLSSTVKSSPYYQHMAKGRLFAVVQELELEQMFNESTTSSSASTPILLQYTEIPPSASASTVLDSSRQSQDSTGTELPSISRSSYDVPFYLRSRNDNNLKVPPSHTEAYGNSFTVKAVLLWNELPSDIRQSNSLNMFKSRVKEYYLSNML